MTFLLANPPATLRGRGLAVLDQALLRTRSGLDEAETWRRLGLSDPTPERPTTAAPARVAADESEEVVTFDHIHVANLRGLEDIVLDAPSPEAGRGQWIVLLGENGSGKTTILRGVSLALTDRSNAAAVLGDARAPYVRTGEAQASCTVRLQGRDFKLTIKAREAGETVDPNGARGAWPWVVAYGCRRGGALGGNDPERARTRFADVATLFDDDRGLIGVESWLSLQHSAAREGDVQADIAYKTVVRVLERVLRFKTLPWRNDGLWVLANDGREVKFAALSDGYLTTAGWVVDLMVRYVERARGKVELKEDFNLRMVGVALVDEIDQHLHPRWQVRVIRELRELFPRMSFVVTTHNPLTLVGARREEVFILREGDARKVVVEQARFDPRLRTGTELYAKFFGIDGLYPDELGRALHRYGLLASNPYRRDDEQAELDGIVKKLRDEGVDPGFDPEPRVSAS
jgi:energy-coupling factor transporter ATP-binding protein EcfA2